MQDGLLRDLEVTTAGPQARRPAAQEPPAA